jgi:hypothetical protein
MDTARSWTRSSSSLTGVGPSEAPGAIALESRKRHVCLQELPNREHHCVVVFTNGAFTVDDDASMPCAPVYCRINLVLSAHNRRASHGDRLLVGGNTPDGRVPQDRGRVNALVIRPGGQIPKRVVTHRRWASGLTLDKTKRVIYSQRVGGLRKGDRVTAEAKAIADIDDLPYNALNAASLVLSGRPNDTHPGAFARRVAKGTVEISEANGFNCTQARTPCVTRKVAGFRVARNAVDRSGEPRPLYVNLVMLAKSKREAPSGGDRVRIAPGGQLEVLRFWPEP